MKQFVVIIEQSANGYAAHSPDVPGCIAAAKTVEEMRDLYREALEFHLEGLQLKGRPIPEPSTIVETFSVAA